MAAHAEMDVATAIEFRQYVTDHMHTGTGAHYSMKWLRDATIFTQFDMAYRMHVGVCACCSRYRENHTVKLYSYTEVPNLHLLSVNGPRSADMPRHALTTQSGLCLQPAARRMDGVDLIITLCDECLPRGPREGAHPAAARNKLTRLQSALTQTLHP